MAASPGCASRLVLLTGPPGVGKTTLVCKVCDELRKHGINCNGFYTQEIRANGKRQGFDVITLDGKRGPLARVREATDIPSGRQQHCVGQYSVQKQLFEQLVLPILQAKQNNSSVLVVDEIGKMELFSLPFQQAIQNQMRNSCLVILATIPIAKGRPLPFVERIRNQKDGTLFTVSKENREHLLDDVVAVIKQAVQA